MKRISDYILYKDHQFIGFNKPAGMLTQEDESGDATAVRLAMAYAHRDLYVIHRLDRPVSGVVLFAKTKEMAGAISKQWHDPSVVKTYLAIVPDNPDTTSREITHFLTFDNKRNITSASDVEEQGSVKAVLNFEVLERLDQYMVLKINLQSGRKHQIRAQLAAIGLPVRGDIKYGSKRTNPDAGIDLHAYSLRFIHPMRNTPIELTAPVPDSGLWKHISTAPFANRTSEKS